MPGNRARKNDTYLLKLLNTYRSYRKGSLRRYSQASSAVATEFGGRIYDKRKDWRGETKKSMAWTKIHGPILYGFGQLPQLDAASLEAEGVIQKYRSRSRDGASKAVGLRRRPAYGEPC